MRLAKIPTRTEAHREAFEAVHRRFECWRSTREHLSPIPEVLWAAAVSVAREHGLNRSARALRLNYYALKERLESAEAQACVAQAQARFVELIAPRVASAGECIVELENARGAKMRIQLKGTDIAELASLSSALWSSVS
jgi:hypothetical protein